MRSYFSSQSVLDEELVFFSKYFGCGVMRSYFSLEVKLDVELFFSRSKVRCGVTFLQK
jgi:hypothetical protein